MAKFLTAVFVIGLPTIYVLSLVMAVAGLGDYNTLHGDSTDG